VTASQLAGRRAVAIVSNGLKEIGMSRTATLAALASALALLTACGDTPGQRAVTGGAIGAASGAVVGSTVGAPVAGAVVGGAGGAVVGAATTPRNDYYYSR
jgi:osmotically inducible lipoprotein OsmB